MNHTKATITPGPFRRAYYLGTPSNGTAQNQRVRTERQIHGEADSLGIIHAGMEFPPKVPIRRAIPGESSIGESSAERMRKAWNLKSISRIVPVKMAAPIGMLE